MNINFIKLSEYAKIPKKANPTDAASDLYMAGWKNDAGQIVRTDHVLEPHQRILVVTDLRVQIPEGYMMKITPRSGLSYKRGLQIPNSPGLIDTSYQGENDNIGIILHNPTTKPIILEIGTRIAQCTIEEVIPVEWNEVKEFETNINRGGFGSTGVN